jgi:hypothetical protein
MTQVKAAAGVDQDQVCPARGRLRFRPRRHRTKESHIMPASARAAPPPAAEQAAQQLGQQLGFDTAAMNGVLQPSRQMAELANSMGTEVLRFASRRLRAQAEYFDALTHCCTMQDILDRQMEFLRRAGSEYTEELGAVMRLAQPTTEAEARKDGTAN